MPSHASVLRGDTVAIIEPWPLATNQASRARRHHWRLRFATRLRPFVDSLMGWTVGRDPLAQVELRFASGEAAERYCLRQGLRLESRSAHPSC